MGIHSDLVAHFKYGSVGVEERNGIPYWVWLVLPDVSGRRHRHYATPDTTDWDLYQVAVDGSDTLGSR